MVRKRIISVAMSIIVASTVFTAIPTITNVKAAQQQIIKEDYTYTKENDGKTSYAIIRAYNGNKEDVVLPEELDGLPVKAIFLTQKDLKIKTITLSKNISSHYVIDSLTNIGTLESIQVAKDNKDYEAVDGVLYSKDKTKLYLYPRAKKGDTYKIPSTVKDVEGLALGGNGAKIKYLKNLITSDKLEFAPDCSQQSSLESVTLSDSIKVIDESSFENCQNLKSIKIGKNVESINDSAFYNCKSLKQVQLPNKLKNIGSAAFLGTSIKEIKIPESVVSIGTSAFSKGVKLNKKSYLKKLKKESGLVYYQARATVRSGKKTTSYKASLITKIKPNKKKVMIKKGKKAKVSTKIYYAKKLKKGYVDPSILKFATSNKKVATISKNGNIKGIKKGKATITVRLRTSNVNYKVKVVVK